MFPDSIVSGGLTGHERAGQLRQSFSYYMVLGEAHHMQCSLTACSLCGGTGRERASHII